MGTLAVKVKTDTSYSTLLHIIYNCQRADRVILLEYSRTSSNISFVTWCYCYWQSGLVCVHFSL